MQKAYHDLKEQALRMSIEQDAQKSQIEEEIKKLKISNQDLIKKNKVTFLQHSKSFENFGRYLIMICAQLSLWSILFVLGQ